MQHQQPGLIHVSSNALDDDDDDDDDDGDDDDDDG